MDLFSHFFSLVYIPFVWIRREDGELKATFVHDCSLAMMVMNRLVCRENHWTN